MTEAPLANVVRSIRHVLPPRPDRPDAELLGEFASGDDQAFAVLVRRHGPLVLGVCRRVLGHLHDAEDAFQATFLVLAKKAASVRKGESLASWLHGVSYRIAMRSRRDAARRRKYESRARPAPAPEGADLSWREVQAVLDEEVAKLPEVYRSTFVLCSLQGLPQAEAAGRLGVKEGTVSSRLTSARKRLQAALARRGISLSALLAGLSLAGPGTAAIPASVVRATAGAAARYAAGTPAGLSAPTLSLAQAALKGMAAGRLRLAALVVLTAGLLASGTILFGRPATPDPAARPSRPAAPPAEPARPKPAPDRPDRVGFSGRVLDAEGKPVAGARVYYHFITREEEPVPVRATTDARGRFSFTLSRDDVPLSADAIQTDPLRTGQVVARADGFTLAWSAGPQGELTLRVAPDDTPVEGRFLDLEGRPLRGLRVRALGVAGALKGDVSEFVKAIESREHFYTAFRNHLTNPLTNPIIGRHVGALLPSTTTDAQGRFRLSGFGKDQLVELRVEGDGVETQNLHVLTGRPGRMLKPERTPDPLRDPGETVTILRNRFEHPLPPGQVVTGVIRDAVTKKPVPRALIQSYMFAGTRLAQNTIYRITADEQGRYRFTGLPRGKGNQVRFGPPTDRPYIPVVKTVPASEPFKESTLDVELEPGVWVDVTARDRATGQPVPGYVSYYILPQTAEEKANRFFSPGSDGYDNFAANRNDGSFRFAAAPRPGLVAIRADWAKYPIAKEAGTIQLPGTLTAANFQAFAEIDPKPGAGPVRVRFELDTGGVVRGNLVGPDGRPVEGAVPAGLRHDSLWGAERPLPKDAFTALGLDPARPRLLCFTHADKRLAGSVVVRGNEKEAVVVKLQPWATVSGRALLADGKPLANARLWFTPLPRPRRGDPHPTDTGMHVVDRSVRSLTANKRSSDPDPGTDADGRFRVEGLVPGLKYHLAVVDPSGARNLDQVKWEGLVFRDLVLKPGESRNLGNVRILPFPKK